MQSIRPSLDHLFSQLGGCWGVLSLNLQLLFYANTRILQVYAATGGMARHGSVWLGMARNAFAF